MSDEAKPALPGRPGAPRPPLGGAPKGPRPQRPAAQPPGPSASSMRLRKFLMLGILVTCVALIGAIGWRIWQKMHAKERGSLVIGEEFDKAMDIGKGASKDIFSIQTKVWGQSKELTPEDFTTIKAKLVELRDCHDKLKELLDVLHERHKEESAEYGQIVPKWLQVKMWILDATDLLENQKPPEYGGLNIPMFLTSEKIRKSQDALKEINTLKDEIIKRNDPEEIKTTRKKLADLRDAFRSHAVKLQDLDKYVADGLARPDLTIKDVIELEQLRDDANKAQMAVVATGKMLQAFPE